MRNDFILKGLTNALDDVHWIRRIDDSRNNMKFLRVGDQPVGLL